MERIYEIRENVDTILPMNGKVRTKKSPYFDIFYPVRTASFSVILILGKCGYESAYKRKSKDYRKSVF